MINYIIVKASCTLESVYLVYSNINKWNQKLASLNTKYIQIGQAVKIGKLLDESGLENTLPSLELCTDLHNNYDNNSVEI